MFLPWVSDRLHLLPESKSTNMLGPFPLKVRQKICGEVVTSLLEPTFNQMMSNSTSDEHLDWCMESIGASFCLPMEDEGIISAAIDIYKRWLLESSKVC